MVKHPAGDLMRIGEFEFNLRELAGSMGDSGGKSELWSKKNLFIIASSLILLAAGLIYEFIVSQRIMAQLLFLAVVGIAGYSIIRRGFSSLVFQRRLNMNFLVAVAFGDMGLSLAVILNAIRLGKTK